MKETMMEENPYRAMGEELVRLEREGKLPEGFDLARYKSTMFRMYSSRRAVVELACDESVMDSIVDRFGRDVDTGLIDDRTFSVTASIPPILTISRYFSRHFS